MTVLEAPFSIRVQVSLESPVVVCACVRGDSVTVAIMATEIEINTPAGKRSHEPRRNRESMFMVRMLHELN